MQWYYSKGGIQSGPIGELEIRAKIASGELSPTDLVWQESFRDWVPASQAGLAQDFPQAVPPPMPAGGMLPPPVPPAAPAWATAGEVIPNYLWQSIVLIMLCWPTGLPAVVYASKVDSSLVRGDIQGARNASQTAKIWCWVGYGFYLAMIVLGMLFFLVMILGAAASGSMSSS
jgi:hypothetical protein